jgi:hypothetical protein
VNFSLPPCENWWFSQGSTPRVGMRSCGHVPNSPRNKNPKRPFHIYLRKWFFWIPKNCCLHWAGAKKTFYSPLNAMISQMVRKRIVRFGRHIDIEVSYKILELEIPKLILILHYLTCFQKGLQGGILSKITLGPLGVNICIPINTIK